MNPSWITSNAVKPGLLSRSRRLNRKARLLAVVVAASLPVLPEVRAADFTWSNLAGGAQAWDNAANWGGAGYPSMPDDRADLSVNLAADLTATIPAAGVTVGTLDLGGTGAPVTTTIAGGTLNFDISTAPAIIISGGVAGSTNIISAPVALHDNLDIDATSTNSLTISGAVAPVGDTRSIVNRMAGGPLLIHTGPINLFDAADPTIERGLGLSGVAGSTTVYNAPFVSGTGGSGFINLGGDVGNNGALYTTHILNQASPNYTGTSFVSLATVIVGDDQAFGTGTIQGNAGHRSHIQSDDPARTLSNNIILNNGLTFDGNNSLTLNGWITQSNNRAMTNNLAPGSTLTLTGTGNGDSIYIFESSDAVDGREFTIDGRGNTVVNGRIRNDELPTPTTFQHHLTKRGSGTLTLTNPNNDYAGETRVEGGLVLFAANDTWGGGAIVVNPLGGVWYTPGSADPNFGAFIAKIAPTSVGALAIPASEAATNFDFSGTGSLGGLPTMSIGAQGDVTYNGTVTPGPNGYYWGALGGTLTLNGNNRMTGANVNATYRNGGTVVVTGTQDYTGVTTIAGANMSTGQARADRRDSNSSRNRENIFFTTALEISQVADGGVASSLGMSGSDAANLVLDGGTLRYTGVGHSTNRLFTTGINGARLDASGSGAVTFGSAGGDNVTNGNTLTLTGTSTAANTIASNLPGTIAIAKNGAGRWVLSGSNTYTGTTSVAAGTLVLGQSQTTTSAVNVSGGTLQLASGGGSNRVLKTPSVTVSGTGQIDLTDNKLITDAPAGTATGGVYDGIQGLVQSGYAGGAWTGSGIISSSAAAVPAGQASTNIGVATGAQIKPALASDPSATALFGGQTITGASTLAMYTYGGDANLDGLVSGDDYTAIDFAIAVPGASGWVNGDFNYDGIISGDDYTVIDFNIAAQGAAFPTSGAASGVTAVPEPASLSVIGLAAAGLLRRRRRAV